MHAMNSALGRRNIFSNAQTGSSASTPFILSMLKALEKDRVPSAPRENQFRQPFQELHTPAATTTWREEFFENRKLTFAKACLLLLDKGQLNMASESSVSFQVRHPKLPLRGSRPTLMSSVTVPELISALLRECMFTSTLLSVVIPGGADSDVLQPPYYMTQFEECLQRLDVSACRGSDVFVAIMDETAAGMLAPFSS
ncbi:hypothetical protein V5799_018860 [Amblyomma americanum]|uniref:Uncharacterized protein n=1 Tax=Amblyomma americanum TaxID=6943 RepID=A0AAQ4EYE1_AMBAM